jgi:glycosyltransferase involved in cell wall biosynthesis
MFPIAILHALAGGVAVVASNVGGIADMVEEGVSGRLVPPDDPPALAEAILALAADEEIRKSMGRSSRLLYEKRFHAAVMAERVEQVYMSVLPSSLPGERMR